MDEFSPTVAFDVTPMVGFRTGIGLAVAETYAALTELPARPRLIPYAFGLSLRRGQSTLPTGTRVFQVPTRALFWAWARADHPRFDPLLRPAGVIHAMNFVAPPSRLPTLVTVHDCTFARLRETAWLPARYRWLEEQWRA